MSLELNPLILNSVQQDYLLELYPLPLYPPLTKRQQNLINHSWIFPTLQGVWGLEFCLFFKKLELGLNPPLPPFPPQKRRGYSERVIYDCWLALCF